MILNISTLSSFLYLPQSIQLFQLVSLGVGHNLYLIIGVGSLFIFFRSYLGFFAFGVFCGFVFSYWGYIRLFSPLVLGFKVVRSVGVGSDFVIPQGIIRYRFWLPCFASSVMVSCWLHPLFEYYNYPFNLAQFWKDGDQGLLAFGL
ncbi:MAG: hypothetical protein EZS28_005691 [Streblomastix strix]|uniref:Uncharacterized protein n=1 Tax=Streblomastix strix TaxID=222440 RepID=A0A5J4WWY3_9EUKA|nr:MAG: hypothetical protein EZS28_005691 [Streblomastix strix]